MHATGNDAPPQRTNVPDGGRHPIAARVSDRSTRSSTPYRICSAEQAFGNMGYAGPCGTRRAVACYRAQVKSGSELRSSPA